MAHVAGYVIVNEFSLPEDSYYRPAVKAKCRDGFCPVSYTHLDVYKRQPHVPISIASPRRTPRRHP